MPYESQYDSILNTTKVLQLYTATTGSFDNDAFDVAYQESLTWAQNRYNSSNRPAPTWQDFVRYRAEERYWAIHFGPRSKFGQLNLRFLGQSPPDPRPLQHGSSQNDIQGLVEASQRRQRKRGDAGSWQRRAEQLEGRSSTPPRSRRERRSRSPTESSSRSFPSPKKSNSRTKTRHSSTKSLARSRSPLIRHKTSSSRRRRSFSAGRVRSRGSHRRSSASIPNSSQTKREESEETIPSEAELTPRQNIRDESPGERYRVIDGVHWVLLATDSDLLTRELQPFFALHRDGQPQFSAVSHHRNATGAFIGRRGCHISVLLDRFPMLRIRCNKIQDGRVFFWAELPPDKRPAMTKESDKYFPLNSATLQKLREAQKLFLTYAVLPMPVLPDFGMFMRHYHDGEYKPPVSSPPIPTIPMPEPPAGRHPWGSPEQHEKLLYRSDDYGRLKYEDHIEEDGEESETCELFS